MTTTNPLSRMRPLQQKILLPLTITSILLVIAGSIVAHLTSEDAIFDRGAIGARSLAAAVAAAAENVGDEIDLQRVVLSIASEPEVELIVIVAGDEARVIASSRNDWLQRRVADIDELRESSELRSALQAQLASTNYEDGGRTLDHTQPVRLDLHGISGLNVANGAIMVHIDTGPMRRHVLRSARWISAIAIGGILFLAVSGLWLLQRHVVAPLRQIEKQLLPLPQRLAPIEPGHARDDQIGTVVAALNQSIAAVVQSQQVAAEASQRLRSIVESSPHGIAVADPATRNVTAMNEALATLFGYSRGEFDALGFWDLHPPEARERVEQEIARIAAGDLRPAVAIPCRHHDGHVFYCNISPSVAHFDGNPMLVAFFTDVTIEHQARQALESFNLELERRVAQRTQELAARTAEFETVVQSIPDTVIRFKPDGHVDFCKLTDDSRLPWLQNCCGGNCAQGRCRFEALTETALALGRRSAVTNANAVGELEYDGGVVELRVSALNDGDYLVLVRDISARRNLERETELALEMERNLSQLKSQFISVASHEFRTPLTAISGSAELLQHYADRLSPEKRQALLQRIVTGVERLTSIIDDTLTLSRVEAGKVQVRREDTDLLRLVRSAVDEARASDDGQHPISLQHTGDTTPVSIDANVVHHILANLLSNAVRYSPAGTAIAVTLAVLPEVIHLTVSDDGIGIPEADRPHIFEPFYRGRNVERIAGTGLGLNIVQRFSELLGGRVELLASPRGASFRCTLPRTDEPSQT